MALRAARGAEVTLLSAPGAVLFAGCLWWREVVRQAHETVPDARVADVLDCADASGLAVSALRIGQRAIVLHEQAPGRAAVVAIADGLGGHGAPSRARGTRFGVSEVRRACWRHGCTVVTRPEVSASTPHGTA